MRIVLALGGNALLQRGEPMTAENQRANIRLAAERIALVTPGNEIVIAHGNGPQVGNLLVKNELAASVVPPVPLDWCGAQTQATLGFVLANALDAALARRSIDRRTAAMTDTAVWAGAVGNPQRWCQTKRGNTHSRRGGTDTGHRPKGSTPPTRACTPARQRTPTLAHRDQNVSTA